MTQDIDDLIARLESYENRDGFNRQLADALRAQRDKIARLESSVNSAIISGIEKAVIPLATWGVEQRERAEAERDALREVVEAAKRVRANTRIPGDTVTECKVPDCLCHSGADFDAALAKLEQEQGR